MSFLTIKLLGKFLTVALNLTKKLSSLKLRVNLLYALKIYKYENILIYLLNDSWLNFFINVNVNVYYLP